LRWICINVPVAVFLWWTKMNISASWSDNWSVNAAVHSTSHDMTSIARSGVIDGSVWRQTMTSLIRRPHLCYSSSRWTAPRRPVGGSVEPSRGPSRTRGMLTSIRRQMSSQPQQQQQSPGTRRRSAHQMHQRASRPRITLWTRATVATKPIERLIKTNGNTFLIFYARFAYSDTNGTIDNYPTLISIQRQIYELTFYKLYLLFKFISAFAHEICNRVHKVRVTGAKKFNAIIITIMPLYRHSAVIEIQ